MDDSDSSGSKNLADRKIRGRRVHRNQSIRSMFATPLEHGLLHTPNSTNVRNGSKSHSGMLNGVFMKFCSSFSHTRSPPGMDGHLGMLRTQPPNHAGCEAISTGLKGGKKERLRHMRYLGLLGSADQIRIVRP